MFCGVYLGWNDRDSDGRAEAQQLIDPLTDPVEPIYPHRQVNVREPATDDPVVGTPPVGSIPPVVSPSPVVSTPPVTDPLCPECEHPNPTTRRFCGKCGAVLRTGQAGPATPLPAVSQPGSSWWQRLRDPADRAAKRNYRRSLSPLHRWRRVIFAALGIGLVAGALTVLHKNPIPWFKDRWYDVTDTTVVVSGVVGRAGPQSPVAVGFDAVGLASEAPAQAWASRWTPEKTTPEACGGGAGMGRVILSLPQPARLRGMDIQAGLAVDDPERLQQFRPRRIDVLFSGGCKQVMLDDVAASQHASFDTGHEVSRVTISVASTYRPPPKSGIKPTHLVAISAITLLKRPD